MQSSGSNISENTIVNCNIGIYLSSSPNNSVAGNNITKSSSAIIAYASSNNIIVENQITESAHYGITLEVGYDNTPSNYNNIIRNNITSNLERGIRVTSSSHCRVEENIIANSEIGIQLYGSACQQNNIINNTVVNHIWGIQMTAGPSFNNVTGNSIANNEYGIYIFNSNSSLFFHNNFINNRRHVSINLPVDVDDSPDSLVPSVPPSVNAWDNGREGNFWSNYTGTDTNGDGVGDTFYVIDDNNQDHFPLMNPVITPLVSIPGFPNNTNSTTPAAEPFPALLLIAVVLVATVTGALATGVVLRKRRVQGKQTEK
jgi:parallel beta-helix repeat protein